VATEEEGVMQQTKMETTTSMRMHRSMGRFHMIERTPRKVAAIWDAGVPFASMKRREKMLQSGTMLVVQRERTEPVDSTDRAF
jgi:hypothetical protein